MFMSCMLLQMFRSFQPAQFCLPQIVFDDITTKIVDLFLLRLQAYFHRLDNLVTSLHLQSLQCNVKIENLNQKRCNHGQTAKMSVRRMRHHPAGRPSSGGLLRFRVYLSC